MISNYDKQVDIGRKIFLDYDQEALIRKYTLDADADFLYLTYLGTKCRINRKTGAIDEMIDDIYTECREYTVVMTIYDMLCHGDSPTLPPLSGKWTLVGNFAAAGSSPQVRLLWDDQSMKYLNFETTYYLQGDLLEHLLQLIR